MSSIRLLERDIRQIEEKIRQLHSILERVEILISSEPLRHDLYFLKGQLLFDLQLKEDQLTELRDSLSQLSSVNAVPRRN